MARRKGSLWHDPLVVVGAEENNGDVVDGRNSALRGGPVGREFMHDNHDPRSNIHVPLASRLGVDNSVKLAAGSLGDGVCPSEFPLPKGNPASAYMLDNLEEKRDKFSIRNNAYVLSEAIIRSSSRGGGEGLVKVVDWGCGVRLDGDGSEKGIIMA